MEAKRKRKGIFKKRSRINEEFREKHCLVGGGKGPFLPVVRTY